MIKFAPLRTLAACLLLVAAARGRAAPPSFTAPGDIPARPEQLVPPPFTFQPPEPAQYRVPLRAGPVAYVVPDREWPLVNIIIRVRVGDYLDPVGREGLAALAGYLLARGGTASHTAEALEERLDFLAADLGSDIAATQGSVTLNLLTKDLDEGFTILREVLTAPRFQEERLALRQRQLLQELKQRNDDSSDIEERERAFLAYGDAFWACRQVTATSLQAIARADLAAFHRRWFHPTNFVVAVSGDFEREAMVARLETLFAAWPFAGEMTPPIPTNTAFAAPGVYLVDKAVNQGRVSVLLPGVLRDDPDFIAVTVMNDILGGGGFSSRIVNRVRSDEGLAYSAYSFFPGGVYYPLAFTAGLQTKSRTVAYAAGIVFEELRRIVSEPVAEKEVAAVTRGMVERLPRTFATKAQVAESFANDEFTGRYARDPAFWRGVRARIEAVTPVDVQRVARRTLIPDRAALLIVGDKREILAADPARPNRLTDFGGGRLVDLPLRDPLTMKPLAATPTETVTPSQGDTTMTPNDIYAFRPRDIDGKEVALSAYRGQVLLLVNVASKCGFTGQYAGLQSLYTTYRDRGFSVLAFPANDFLSQEPGSEEEIKSFCTTQFAVTFPLFAKIVVKGEGQHPLYAYLTDKKLHPQTGGPISWNFNKFLVGRDGRMLARFGSRDKPLDADVVAAIEAALAAPLPSASAAGGP